MADKELYRLDILVLNANLANTRAQAEELIKTYGVLVNGKLVNKPGKKFSNTIKLEKIIQENTANAVAKGMLEKALANFTITVTNKNVLDIGTGVGGFVSLYIEQKAKRIFTVDKQANLLNTAFKNNKALINLSKTAVRELTPALVTEQVDFCMIDVDDTKTNLVLPFIHTFLKTNADVLLVLKPQIELDKKAVQKGTVKDVKRYKPLLEKIKKTASFSNLLFQDFMESPVLGKAGNREFILYFTKK